MFPVVAGCCALPASGGSEVSGYNNMNLQMPAGPVGLTMQQGRIKGNVHAVQLVELLIFCFHARS